VWQLSPLVLAGASFGALRFAHAFVRLRRRGRHDHAGWGRAALFAAGLACVTLPLVSPLGVAAESSLAAHMLEHVLVGDAAPALLLLAVRGPIFAFMLPAAFVRTITRQAMLGALARFLGRPSVALAGWALVYAAWHVPAAYDAAVAYGPAHHVEHASFMAVGVLVWLQLIDPARRNVLSVAQRLAFLGCLFVLGQVLSCVLLLSTTPLFTSYPEIADQQLSAVVMMAEQMAALGTCAALLLAASLRGRGARPGRPPRSAAALG
jgi:cytochrome c oxidase assembly factor CtaG